MRDYTTLLCVMLCESAANLTVAPISTMSVWADSVQTRVTKSALLFSFFFQAEDGIRDLTVTGVQTCALPIFMDPVAAMRPDASLARIFVKETSSEIAGGGAHAAVSEEQVAEVDEQEFSQNVSDKVHMHAGDMEAGWQEAEVIVERTFTTSVVHQSYMEPQSITVVPDDYGHRMTIWPSSQAMLGARSDVAQALSIPERQIRVESVPIGGAFGGKFGLIEPLAAAAAFASRKPVRLTFTRSEDFSAGNPAPQSMITLKIGAKNDGTLVAMQGTVIFDTGAYAGSAVFLGGITLGSSYRCPNYDFRCFEVMTNKVGVGAYRAPGAPQATFALESTVDELCQKLQMDAVEFRLKNGLKEGDPTMDHRSWPRIGLLDCLEQAQQQSLWAQRLEQKDVPEELNGWKIGVGIAAGFWNG